jgi:DNA repair exonuclease SbcCD ATPase subunit/3',5'-cyclic AMP phosphodiesterase CpdA
LIKTDIVNVPFQKLKYIHHISDIQIRNLKRHREYEEVFERTYKEIAKNKDNSVVYIGGDIAHSKTDMSPELVHQLSELFKNLADICPTIIIAGNHDCNLNNLNRLDVLTPIVNNLNHPDLHYLKDSGVYKCADVSFVVWDCWTDEKDFITSDQVDGDTKVVLFHGTVDRAETDLGFFLPSDVHIDKFKGYDLGLLGDIHKKQFLNKEETIAYCGSLVQQNHGEGLSHGYLLWDVPKRKSEYIEIQNDYGYYTLNIDGGVVPDVSDMPKKPRLRVRVANTSPSELKKALAVIHNKYGVQEMAVTRTDTIYSNERVRNKSISVGDVSNSDVQFGLIKEYLENNHIVSDDVLLKIKNINETLNANLPEEEVYRNLNWKLKKLEFSNMFSYGEDNVVDFTKLNGIVGMFAPNANGKSALLDALSFALFDTCSRAFKAENILNNKKDDFYCKVTFEIDNQEYVVERKAKKQRKGNVKVDVDFYTYDDLGEKVSMNGDQRRTTDVNIRKVIGTYEDFILTSLSSQNNNSVFIEKTQKEKKMLLAQFMGLEVFDKLWTTASEEIKDVSAVLRDFKKNDWERELSDIKEEKEDLDNKHKKLIEAKNVVLETKKLQEKEIKDLTRELKSIDKSVSDIESLKQDKETFKKSLQTIDTQLVEVKEKWDVVVESKKKLEDSIKYHNDNDTENKYVTALKQDESGRQLKIDLENLKDVVQIKVDKINKLGNLDYDEDCDYCMKNPFTLDAIETKKSIDEDKNKVKDLLLKIDKYEKWYSSSWKEIEEQKNNFSDSMDKLQKTSILMSETRQNVELLEEKQKNYINQEKFNEEKIQKYYKQEKDIVHNTNVENKIEGVEKNLEDTNFRLDKINKETNTVYAEIKVLDNKRKNILDNIDKVADLEDKYEAYQYYLDAVKRDGVPYDLITKALPTIEDEVNNILSQLVDFSMTFEMDGKNINNYIVYDDNIWPLELSSGMEKFISSLAIRVGLINVSSLPRSNFLAIDEGFGTMDSDNLNSIYNLFQYLKSQFQFTMIVSHIDSMRDTVDTLLEVKKEKGFSNINFD